MKRSFRIAVALLALAAPVAAQEQQVDRPQPPPAPFTPGKTIDIGAWEKLRDESRQLSGTSVEYREAFERAAIESLAVRTAWEKLQLDYENRRLAQRAETFAWQQTSSVLIFALVALVVLSGLGLSFWHVLRAESAPTKLTIGDKGIEVSSRLVGVLVFVLSLAFFYLYLQNVYPIVEVAPAKAASEAPQGDGETR